MERCPICKERLRDALVVCRYCGEALPLRVVVVSEGSHGGGFAVVEEERKAGGRRQEAEEKVNER